jgi:Protein of unknown function (DUF3712)
MCSSPPYLFILTGINSFGHAASLSNVSVQGSGGAGGNQYIISPLTTTLQNPSNITLDTVDISLPVIYKGVMIGRAAVSVSVLINTSPIRSTDESLRRST